MGFKNLLHLKFLYEPRGFHTKFLGRQISNKKTYDRQNIIKKQLYLGLKREYIIGHHSSRKNKKIWHSRDISRSRIILRLKLKTYKICQFYVKIDFLEVVFRQGVLHS